MLNLGVKSHKGISTGEGLVHSLWTCQKDDVGVVCTYCKHYLYERDCGDAPLVATGIIIRTNIY